MDTNTRAQMFVTGGVSFAFFLIANFTHIFLGARILAGLIQIAFNVVVLITWYRGYKASVGFAKFVALFGVIIPPVMAGITIARVLIPHFFTLP